MTYALQIRDNAKQRWTVVKGWLFRSELQAFDWLCSQPTATRPSTEWGWRVRPATDAELRKVHHVPMTRERGEVSVIGNVFGARRLPQAAE